MVNQNKKLAHRILLVFQKQIEHSADESRTQYDWTQQPKVDERCRHQQDKGAQHSLQEIKHEEVGQELDNQLHTEVALSFQKKYEGKNSQQN